jgi:hypothetical protein
MRCRRCLPRILLNAATVVSLMLGVATIALWVLSYWRADALADCQPTTERGVISTCGRLLFYDEAAMGSYRYPPPIGWAHVALPPATDIANYAPTNTTRFATLAGFGVLAGDTGRYTVTARIIPHWFIALATAVFPAIWLRTRRRRHRSASGLCAACGYDLRATPDRCPECGAVPPPPPA